jgi:hypothetical protein
MSGLHHAAPPSFFPTAKELSSGLQWFKEHPILAAAAAATVSVITYLHTADDGDVDANGAPRDLLMADDAEALATTTATTTPLPRPALGRTLSDATPMTRVTSPPPALRKPGSEGKMSPAAVTWVDEHGGSLTQVFEHLLVHAHDDDEHDGAYPDLDGPVRAGAKSSRHHGRPPTPRRKLSEDEASASPGHWMGPLGVQSLQSASGIATPPTAGDRQTESPQWGWYVPITPPQDHLAGAVASLRPPLSSRSTATAAAVVAAIHSESLDASASLRRSASGRIKAA